MWKRFTYSNKKVWAAVIVFLVLLAVFNMPSQQVRSETRTIRFSNYLWKVKDYREYERGPGPNYWSDSPENVWADEQGNLHLRITKQKGKWYCTEVYLDRFLGYGQYVFYLDPVKKELPDEAVVGLFLYGGPGEELDIEISGWDKAKEPNLQFVVQPAYITGHLDKVDLNPLDKKRTFKINWQQDRVIFALIKGHNREPKSEDLVIERWIVTGSQIPEGRLYPHMNLWLFEGNPPERKELAEIVVKKFEFIQDISF